MNVELYKVRGGYGLHRRDAFLRMLRLGQKACGLDSFKGILQVVLIPRETMAEMNWKHLRHEGATDVLTFDLRNDEADFGDEENVIAEVYVCPEVAVDYAREHGLDPSKELALYALHGMLHLSGQDDIEDEDRLEMRRKEAAVMAVLESQGVHWEGFLNV